MEETPVKLFVIVVTYNGKQWYDRCFSSLRNSTIPLQTIVVDNASNDGTVEYIKEHYPEIILIESKENLGFGKANNIAMRYALEHCCDYVFLLNQDTWLLEEDTLEQLVYIAERHQEFGIISPMHVMADGESLNMMYEYCFGVCSRNLVKDLYRGQLKEIYETDYVNAAAWLLPSKTLEIVGGFDPLFIQYGEDDDYLHRAYYHKIKIGICPQLSIVHDHTNDNWSEEGQQFFKKANEIHLEMLLDINKEYSYIKLQWSNIKRLLKALLSKDEKQILRQKQNISYLKRNNSDIKEHRRRNMESKKSWL